MKLCYAALVLALSAAGCGGSGEGTVFKLVRSASDTLPILLAVEQSCHVHLDSAAVIFHRQGGEYTSTFFIRRDCSDEADVSADIVRGTDGTFTMRNDTAFFRDSLANPAGIGVITADSLIVQGPLHRLTYLRQFNNPR